ncbi:MAG: hypothetical protein ACE5K4_04465 [Candidatus Hydrothermarchaeota archaeon]
MKRQHYGKYSLLDDSFRGMLRSLEGEKVDPKVARNSLNALRARIDHIVGLYEDLMIEGREEMKERANQIIKVMDNMLKEFEGIDDLVPMDGTLRDHLVQLNAALGSFVLYVGRSELVDKVSDRLSLQILLTESLKGIEDRMKTKIDEMESRIKKIEEDIRKIRKEISK